MRLSFSGRLVNRTAFFVIHLKNRHKYNLVRIGGWTGIFCAARRLPPEPIRADPSSVRRALSMFGFLDYRGWHRWRLNRPRAERMRENIPITPST